VKRQTVLLALFVALPGCNRCSGSTVGPPDAAIDAAPEVVQVDVLPPPAAWSFEPVRLGPTFPGTALPPGCSMREPLVRAKVRPSSRFVAAPHALGTLVIADADATETPPRLVGVAAMDLDPGGTSTNPVAIPWVEAAAMPRLARTSTGAWLAAYAEPAAGKLSEVLVFQNGSATSLGEGDKFEAVDLSCNGETCLLITTRLGQVSGAGADVWIGKPTASVTSWQRQEIVPAAGDSDARPSCIARMDATWTNAKGGAGQGPVVALFEGPDLIFWGIDAGDKPQELGKVAAPHGLVDATVLGRPVAFVYGAPVDEEGCAKQGGIMRFSRLGAADIEVRAPAPATSGVLRPLGRGGLATYLAPLGCGAARKVVFAVVLGDDGAPTSQPMPVSDATSFAVTTEGEKVDMWIQREGEKVDMWVQREEEVVWIRARCGAP
jgi:hypothetical protein